MAVTGRSRHFSVRDASAGGLCESPVRQGVSADDLPLHQGQIPGDQQRCDGDRGVAE